MRVEQMSPCRCIHARFLLKRRTAALQIQRTAAVEGSEEKRLSAFRHVLDDLRSYPEQNSKAAFSGRSMRDPEHRSGLFHLDCFLSDLPAGMTITS